MKPHSLILCAFALLLPFAYAQAPAAPAQAPAPQKHKHTHAPAGLYPGFDQNIYPGDGTLATLHQNLAYVGYWLNNPPGDTSNTWRGKRAVVARNGFGFLILFNGRLDSAFTLKRLNPEVTGRGDAAKAIAAAKAEGFPDHAIIFLDLEEGGRMMPHTARYFAAWVDTIQHSGYRPGVYCSGIQVEDDPGTTISTADDIHAHFPDVALWLANDQCPPAPGCTLSTSGLHIDQSGRPDALVWQYAQSPRRHEFTAKCAATYAKDGNCYVPGTPRTVDYSVDLNLSTSPDPSAGR